MAPKGPQRPQTTPNAAFCLSRGTFWVGRGLWEPPWVNEKTPGEGTNAGFLGVSTPSPAQGTPGPNTPGGSASVSAAAAASGAAASPCGLVKMGDGECNMLTCDVGGVVFDGSLSIIKYGILEVRTTPGDDVLNEEDFDRGTVDVQVKRKEPTVGFGWKPLSRPPSERGPKRSKHIPRSRPSRPTLCVTKLSQSGIHWKRHVLVHAQQHMSRATKV